MVAAFRSLFYEPGHASKHERQKMIKGRFSHARSQKADPPKSTKDSKLKSLSPESSNRRKHESPDNAQSPEPEIPKARL